VAYQLPLPLKLKRHGWKVKIADKERLEEPHVTILWKTNRWRWSLRERRFMDATPDPADVPSEVLAELAANYEKLTAQ